MEDNRQKALQAALGQIERQFGKGSVMRMGDAGVETDITTISTGSLGLDIALGLADFLVGELLRYTDLNLPARPRWPCRSLPRRKRQAAPQHS